MYEFLPCALRTPPPVKNYGDILCEIRQVHHFHRYIELVHLHARYSFRYLCQCCLQVRPLSYRELLSFHVPLAFALTVPGKPYWLHSHWFSHQWLSSEAAVFSAEEQRFKLPMCTMLRILHDWQLRYHLVASSFPPPRKCATVPKILESLRKCHAVMNPSLVTFTVVHALFAMTLSSMLLNAIMMHSNSAS